MPQAYHLLCTVLIQDPVRMRKALEELEYYLRRNHAAHQSHRKKETDAPGDWIIVETETLSG